MTVAAGGGVGCSPKAAPTSSAASAEVVASAAPAPPPAPSASVAVKVPLQVQKFVLTSEVKGKEPVDELATAAAGKRLYAHLQVRNRGETRPLRLEFRVDGALRSKIDLEVIHSWSYRTWGYNTLRATDAGLVAEAKILDGEEIVASAKIPIAKEEKTKKK
jgi:hypothetical protein